jgi:GntR family transcriptional regulator, transcriptional repressor for pyruvate dehydrogenase complex
MNESTMSPASGLIRIHQEGKTESVTRRLIEMIDLGLFAEGEQLPSESALANQLGVATVTLRDALAVLRERGVIETRRGRNGGSFICAAPQTTDQSLFDQLRELSTLQLRDLADEHAAISGAAARLAAQRAGPEQHARLSSFIDALANAQGRRERRRADARFHIEIAVAAQSVRLTHSEARLQAELGELLWLPFAGQPDPQTIEREHRAIFEAIAANDANLAGALAEAHVARGIRRLSSLRLQQMAEDNS